jgi:hypothetical protein
MEGVGLGVMDVIRLALIDGGLAGAIDDWAALLLPADDVTPVGEQALVADEHPTFKALDEEDTAGIRFRELDLDSAHGL